VNELRRLSERYSLQNQVRFLGFLEKDELGKLLSDSDVLVVPSEYEGYGIVYLEGMGFGLPAIATKAGAAGEIITHEENGYLIEPGNVAELVDRLGKLHSDRNGLLKLSYAALERYRRQPGWQYTMAIAAKFLETYIIDSKPKTPVGG